MSERGLRQNALATASGVDQASISRFCREENPEGMSGENVLRLYPFVYGSSQRSSPSTPITGTPQSGNCTHADPTPQE